MKLKIKHKLFLALLFTSVVVSLSIHLFVKYSFERGFKDYVKAQEIEQLELLSNQLVEYFQKEGSWGFIDGNHRLWRELHRQNSSNLQPQEMENIKRMEPPHAEGPLGRPLGQLDGDPGGVGKRISLYDADSQLVIGGRGGPQSELKMIPMAFQGSTIGYLGLVPDKRLFARDRHFLREQGKAFAFIPLLIVVLSLLISFPLTTHLLRPIQAMTEGTRKLIAGKFTTRIPVKTEDELGVLSKDFNSLATTLEKNEKNRKQWVADISHELRTPLSILRGEVGACSVLADPDRLQQLFSNILENSLRYTNAPGMVLVFLKISKDNLVVSFSDSFPTVPKEQLSRLFERFYRVEASRNRGTGGVGLGLAICRNIVDGHEGTIKAASSSFGGVSIQIELPLA